MHKIRKTILVILLLLGPLWGAYWLLVALGGVLSYLWTGLPQNPELTTWSIFASELGMAVIGSPIIIVSMYAAHQLEKMDRDKPNEG